MKKKRYYKHNSNEPSRSMVIIIANAGIKCSLYARCYTKHFPYTREFIRPHNNQVREVIMAISSLETRNCGTERLSNLSKIRQLANSRVMIPRQFYYSYVHSLNLYTILQNLTGFRDYKKNLLQSIS